jgi:SAM-dependent methyltransferase
MRAPAPAIRRSALLTLLAGALAVTSAPSGAQSDASAWNKFFQHNGYVFGTEPIPLLKEYVHMFRRGRALDLAMGEGRNAVFLAEQGFEVDGVDFSKVALEKAQRLAGSRAVTMHVVQADLRNYQIPPQTYDLITNIYYPQRDLFEQIKAGLKPGGVFVYEQWHPVGWKTRKAPAPVFHPFGAPTEADVYQYSDVRLDELVAIFAGYQIVLYREATVDQALGGTRHGMMLTEVSSLIAKKPFD